MVLGSQPTGRTFEACGPFGPWLSSNSTFWFSSRFLYPSPAIALKCTNTSGPSSWEMKPKPFSELNHFTVPVATYDSPPLLAVSDLNAVRRPAGLCRPGNRTSSPATKPCNCGVDHRPVSAAAASPGHPGAAALRAEHDPGRGDGHALRLELVGQLEAGGPAGPVALVAGGGQTLPPGRGGGPGGATPAG